MLTHLAIRPSAWATASGFSVSCLTRNYGVPMIASASVDYSRDRRDSSCEAFTLLKNVKVFS